MSMKGWYWPKVITSVPPNKSERESTPTSPSPAITPPTCCFHGTSSKLAPFLFQNTYEVKSLVAFLFHPNRRDKHGFAVARDIIVKRPDLVERSTIKLLLYIGTEILLKTASRPEMASRFFDDARLVAGTIVALSDWITHKPQVSAPSEKRCGMTRADLKAFDECYKSRFELLKFYNTVIPCNCLRAIMFRASGSKTAFDLCCQSYGLIWSIFLARQECQHLDWCRHAKFCSRTAKTTAAERATFEYEAFVAS